mmetsp:Transcript_36100/g.90589  ORF Transcript_36100/g.90589 Transcript_36100/m.90589 type:complete len:586 (+) Transcript_36100:49-1806(+)
MPRFRTIWRVAAYATAATAVGAAGCTAVCLWSERHVAALDWQRDPLKEDLVIVGAGWGAVAALQSLGSSPARSPYNVTVVADRDHFLFTPLLPSAAVGTLQVASLATPMRWLCTRAGARFLLARAVDVDVARGVLVCESLDSIAEPAVQADGVATPSDKNLAPATPRRFEVAYDKLVLAVGATNNTFGTPGVTENCHFLKSADDVKAIKAHTARLFEEAALPSASTQDRKRLLHFVIVGGGPTGVEIAAELRDYVEDDLSKLFPKLVQEDFCLSLVQSGDHILNTYDLKISEYAERKFSARNINLLLHSRVKAVTPTHLQYTDAHRTLQTLPYGLCVWSTGIAANPLVQQIAKALPEQENRKALTIDSHMRVLGTGEDKKLIFAVGDCTTTSTRRALDSLEELFRQADTDGSGCLSREELVVAFDSMVRKFPHMRVHLKKVHQLFDRFDANRDGQLSIDEFRTLLADVDANLKSYPATAQVAVQQGQFLGGMLARLHASTQDARWGCNELNEQPSFAYRHLGSMAYVGSEDAVIDWDHGFVTEGAATFWLWKSVYLSEQVSTRTRVLLAWDWARTFFFGRDVSSC